MTNSPLRNDLPIVKRAYSDQDDSPAMVIQEITDRKLIQLGLNDQNFTKGTAILRELFSLDQAPMPHQSIITQQGIFMRPEPWKYWCELPADTNIMDIKEKFDDADFLDITDGRATIDLAGEKIYDVMARLTSAEITAENTVIGSFFATQIHHVMVHIIRITNTIDYIPRFRIIMYRSFGDFLYTTIIAQSKQFGITIA